MDSKWIANGSKWIANGFKWIQIDSMALGPPPFGSICYPFVSICYPFVSICYPFASICIHLLSIWIHLDPFGMHLLSICYPFASICIHLLAFARQQDQLSGSCLYPCCKADAIHLDPFGSIWYPFASILIHLDPILFYFLPCFLPLSRSLSKKFWEGKRSPLWKRISIKRKKKSDIDATRSDATLIERTWRKPRMIVQTRQTLFVEWSAIYDVYKRENGKLDFAPSFSLVKISSS